MSIKLLGKQISRIEIVYTGLYIISIGCIFLAMAFSLSKYGELPISILGILFSIIATFLQAKAVKLEASREVERLDLQTQIDNTKEYITKYINEELSIIISSVEINKRSIEKLRNHIRLHERLDCHVPQKGEYLEMKKKLVELNVRLNYTQAYYSINERLLRLESSSKKLSKDE